MKRITGGKDIFREASDAICTTAESAISEKGFFSLVLSGGNTPKKLFTEFAENSKMRELLRNSQIFWGDERCVPPDCELSNYMMAKKYLLSKVDIPKENIHRIEGELPPEEAADHYEKLICELRRKREKKSLFDVVLLGIGTDGHTASIFPKSPAADESVKLVVPVDAPTHIEPRLPRVTLTFPALLSAEHVIVLAEGSKKMEIIREIEENIANCAYPAARLREKAEWYISNPEK